MNELIYDQSMNIMRLVFAALVLMAISPVARSAELIMVEQAGCEWCEAWDKEIGGIYHKTPEGKIAPLRRVNIHRRLPEHLAFIDRLVYTPTFVLVHHGREVGRILGYPGEDFFWGLLRDLLEKLPARHEWHARADDKLDRAARKAGE